MAPMINVSNKVLEGLDSLGIEYSLENSIKQIADSDTSNWISMPREFSKLNYNLVVNPERLSYNSAVEKAGKSLDLELKNTGKDSLGREFIGDINWQEALKLNLLMGNKTLSPREGLDFLNLLYQGMQGEIDVYTEAGKKLNPKKDLKPIFEDIIKVQFPWRAEWWDADFKMKSDKLYLNTKHELQNGILVQKYSKPLTKNTLMKDKRVSFPSLLETKTEQGMVSKKTKSGDFYTWAPMKDNNSVAGFDADDGGAGFDADRGPSLRGSHLGVRAAEQRE